MQELLTYLMTYKSPFTTSFYKTCEPDCHTHHSLSENKFYHIFKFFAVVFRGKNFTENSSTVSKNTFTHSVLKYIILLSQPELNPSSDD